MTNSQRKQAKDKLCGKSTGIIVALIIILMILALTMLMALLLYSWIGIRTTDPVTKIIEYIFAILIVGIFVVIFDLTVGYFSHRRYLKQDFDVLQEWKKEKLLSLAHEYGRGKYMCVGEDYIYGIMAEQRRGRKKSVYPKVFRYIHLSEVTWAYRIEKYTQVSSCTGVDGQPSGMVRVSEDLRLYTRDGRYLQGRFGEEEAREVFKQLKEKNPSCKLGYDKKWKNASF